MKALALALSLLGSACLARAEPGVLALEELKPFVVGKRVAPLHADAGSPALRFGAELSLERASSELFAPRLSKFKAAAGPDVISMDEFRRLQLDPRSKFTLVDTRDPEEFKDEHIPGAINIPLNKLPEGLAAAKDSLVIVSCGCCEFDSCPNAQPGAKRLAEAGFTNVKALDLKEGLGAWKAAGYPLESGVGAIAAAARRPISLAAVLEAISRDLASLRGPDRSSQRYFLLTHLHNDESVSPEELDLARAGLAVAVNSLSWKEAILPLRAVDAEKTVFALDLREFGWDRAGLWGEIAKRHPFSLRQNFSPDAALKKLDADISQALAEEAYLVRGDWFALTATRPPLYHLILELPANAASLESLLEVYLEKAFLEDDPKKASLRRAALTKSGVSSQNRLVERVPAKYGYYWKSYDFKDNDGRSNLNTHPLGPEFRDNPFPDESFAHAGGEIIFSLPNGLQAYFLVDNKGRRIDEAPADIVSDPFRTAGTPVIVNGLSCMRCHANGIIEARDALGASLAREQLFSRPAREKLGLFHLPAAALEQDTAADNRRFRRSADSALKPVVRGEPTERLRAGVGSLADRFNADLNLERAAAELFLPRLAEFRAALRANPKLERAGLGPFADGGTVKRLAWQSLEGGVSPFQIAAAELELGRTPLNGGVPSFRPNARVEFVVRAALKAGMKLETRWIQSGGATRVASATAGKDGEFFLKLFVDPEPGKSWALGDYKLEFYADGEKLREEPFRIAR